MQIAFKISDIQRSLINGEGFAAVSLMPILPDVAPNTTPFAPTPGISIATAQPIRVTGLPAAGVADWNLGDTIDNTMTKRSA